MCGIIAYLGSDDYKQYVLSGLKLLLISFFKNAFLLSTAAIALM